MLAYCAIYLTERPVPETFVRKKVVFRPIRFSKPYRSYKLYEINPPSKKNLTINYHHFSIAYSPGDESFITK